MRTTRPNAAITEPQLKPTRIYHFLNLENVEFTNFIIYKFRNPCARDLLRVHLPKFMNLGVVEIMKLEILSR